MTGFLILCGCFTAFLFLVMAQANTAKKEAVIEKKDVKTCDSKLNYVQANNYRKNANEYANIIYDRYLKKEAKGDVEGAQEAYLEYLMEKVEIEKRFSELHGYDKSWEEDLSEFAAVLIEKYKGDVYYSHALYEYDSKYNNSALLKNRFMGE